MLDLNKICQPGERITIVTRAAVIVGVIPETYDPFKGPEGWASEVRDPLTDKVRLHLYTHGGSGCASGVGSGVGIEVQLVRVRGQD